MVQTLLQIVYFYNPLLWVANAVIRKVREQAVDEMVLAAMGEGAEDYPEALLNISRLTFNRGVLSLRLIGVVESKKALSGRIKHILSRPFPKTAKLGIIGLMAVIVAGAVLLPMAKAEKGKDELSVKPMLQIPAIPSIPAVGAITFDIPDLSFVKTNLKGRHDRIVQMSEPFAAGSKLIAKNERGSIAITGADINECVVKATIIGQAESDEEAKELAEKTQVKLNSSKGKIVVEIEKDFDGNQFVGIALEITVPKQSNIDCVNSRGSITLVNIEGDIKGTAERGSINGTEILGHDLKIAISRGNIILNESSAKLLEINSSRSQVNISKSSADVVNISSDRCSIDFDEDIFQS